VRILFADDSRTLRASTSALLRSMGHEVIEASHGQQAINLFRGQLDLVILDVDMPVMDGYETARQIRAMTGDNEWIPIIFLSAHTHETDVARGIEAGGDDYLMKPPSAVVLRAKINAMQRITDMRRRLVEMSRELAQKNQALEVSSSHDGLTGIPNRRAFDEALEREWHRAVRTRSPLALILGDVDHFKNYNDSYGHLRGDECLKLVAGALQHTGRRSVDVVARYGGEEFAMLLPDTPPVSALLVAGRALEAVRALGLPHGGSITSGHVTVSLGVCAGVPASAKQRDELVRIADRALYDAKSRGRNQAVILPFPG
jgi:diguanylate cyclase (GGDEF)-like protein